MIEQLKTLFAEFQQQISQLQEQATVLNLKAEYLGKKGKISEVMKSLRDCSAEEKKEIGPKANEIKDRC
jgi:phenylalanyl-tRNA synthetase alpha chain